MKSEALQNIKTMRSIKTSSEVLRARTVKTTNSLSKAEEEENPVLTMQDSALKQKIAQEKAHLDRFDRSVENSRKNILKSREKLAATIARNKALTEVRHELQRSRWEEKDPPMEEQTKGYPRKDSINKIELEY